MRDSMKKINKISIVIPVYRDQLSLLMQTINSVLNQTYSNWELIIVQGDRLLIKDNRFKIIYRKPCGIADAFNAGIKASNGDYLYFLGVGDILWNKTVLEKMMVGVSYAKDWLICGRINRIDGDEKKTLYTSGIEFQKWQLLYKMALPHQALFTSKNFFQKYGYFDTKCKYAMDYEILLRAYHDFPPVIMKDMVVAGWRTGGIGTGKTNEVINEYYQIRLKNKIASAWILKLIYILSVVKASFAITKILC
jgi:glycosyltransferase involved in cell wall biosynthesis